jgi:hypothetical protein
MAQTTAREALNCLGFSYFAKKGSQSNIEEFSSIVHEFYFNDDNSVVSPYKQNLASTFNFQRIKELYKAGQSEALKPAGSDYPKRVYEKDFPQGKSYMAEGGLATKLDVEIKSAYLTAEVVNKSNITSSLSQYIFYDQSTDFMKTVKDDALEKTVKALDLPKDVGSDILSSVDVIMVKATKENVILKDFEENITGSQVSNMDILNNLAHGKRGQNTFRTLTNKYFDSKDMIGISLKKVPTNRNADLKIIGTISGAKELEVYLDPYTEFLGKISTLDTKAELYKLINELVEIVKIMPTDPRAVFSVKYKLNYKNIDISDKIVNLDLQIGRSGFNASESGKMGFVGGASYAVTLPILKKYPRYNEMVREVISIREKAFNFAVNEKKVTADIKSSHEKALKKVKMNELVLYNTSDNEVIKKFCEEYDLKTRNTKDSYQEYRIAVSKLCKNKSLKSPHGALATLDKKSNKTTGVPKTLQNDYVHSQGLWMYTRKGEDLKMFFKQQISLTLYGLMSKKGAKLFYSKNRGRGMLTEDAFVHEFKAKNNKTKLARFATAPYILID